MTLPGYSEPAKINDLSLFELAVGQFPALLPGADVPNQTAADQIVERVRKQLFRSRAKS